MIAIKSIYFDFGYVIGFPPPGLERRFLYLDWNGIEPLFADEALRAYWKPELTLQGLQEFLETQLYSPFVVHEQTDLLDPQSNSRLLRNLSAICTTPVDQQFINRMVAHLDTMKFIELHPETRQVLATLSQRPYRISMISNMLLPGWLLRAKLNANGLLHFFQTISISSEVGFMKPHPEIFKQTLAQDGITAGEVVFVGDTYAQDIVGAKAVGLQTIWLNSRNEPTEWAKKNPPDYTVNNLVEVLDVV
jgi:HAD superfamily hydrolase (TIGR01549 family)